MGMAINVIRRVSDHPERIVEMFELMPAVVAIGIADPEVRAFGVVVGNDAATTRIVGRALPAGLCWVAFWVSLGVGEGGGDTGDNECDGDQLKDMVN
jgi:hypothetical protein